ncbi:MAG TPA: alpha/beta hydrolase [Kofleriaceae bacterium]|nr:alpha/beta hydrolase [Kofleriaceae bacterium]
MPGAPFRQLPFEEVPDLPTVPHRWAQTSRRDVAIRTDELGTCRIAVRELGDGPPLVLVHGLMTASYSFRYVLDLLGKTHRLIIPDLPGAGASDHPDVYLGPDVLARALIATLDAVGARGATVIGNSMGGYLCMRAALLDPGAIGRLVNLHSPGVPTARMIALHWALRLLPAWPLLDRLVRRDPERWVHRNVHYYDESLKSREEHREYAAPLRERAGRRTFYRHLRDTLDARELARFVRALRQAPFPIPLLLVYAARDPMVPPSVGRRLRALVPAAGFVELPEASHFAHVDAPARFVAAIEPFLSGPR